VSENSEEFPTETLFIRKHNMITETCFTEPQS